MAQCVLLKENRFPTDVRLFSSDLMKEAIGWAKAGCVEQALYWGATRMNESVSLEPFGEALFDASTIFIREPSLVFCKLPILPYYDKSCVCRGTSSKNMLIQREVAHQAISKLRQLGYTCNIEENGLANDSLGKCHKLYAIRFHNPTLL